MKRPNCKLAFIFLSLLIVVLRIFGTSATTGVLIPLYSYPTNGAWSSLIEDHQTYPSVPIIAIINPDNGPGTSMDENFFKGISNFQSAGITSVGYVYTSYGERNISEVESDITNYKNWYFESGLSGILFDEVSDYASTENYYRTLASFVIAQGMNLTLGNPGTEIPSSFIGILEIYNIYENAGLPSNETLSSSTKGYSSSNFAMIAYDVASSSVTESYVTSVSKYVNYMYITNQTLPNPYTELPPYFLSLLSYLNLSSSSSAPSTSTEVISTHSSSSKGTILEKCSLMVVIASIALLDVWTNEF